MGNMWIIDVLSDLRTFAEENGMPVLAAELQLTSAVAAIELETTTGTVSAIPKGNGRQLGDIAWSVGTDDRS